jgi:serine/threonine-protein kinase RIO1
MKSAYRKKQEAIERESKALQQIKKRLGVRSPKPLKGATQSPLLASTLQRKANPAPTSDRIPGPAPADDFMHAHKWKRGFQEDAATVKEIRRKASKIAPAYNKGALQYLPDEKDG